jgi:hypothetical protein
MTPDQQPNAHNLPSSNGPAYTTEEQRAGPPLTYVSEKIRAALCAARSCARNIQTHVPENLGHPTHPTIDIREDFLAAPAHEAVHYSATAFLALNNMLGAAHGHPSLAEWLVGKTDEEFRLWLEAIEQHGCVRGLADIEPK